MDQALALGKAGAAVARRRQQTPQGREANAVGRISLLGVPCFRDAAGGRRGLRYRKGWGLLAWLVLEPSHWHRRAQLAELLWPALPEAAALTNLRQVLVDLKQCLALHGAAEALTCERTMVRWNATEALAIDLDALRLGKEMPDAPGGSLLEGLEFDDCVAFSRWLSMARQRMARDQARLLERMRDAFALQGRACESVDIARRLVALDPWDEARYRGLMRVLALAGEYDRALEVFEEIEGMLRHEMGVEPEPETLAMCRGIRSTRRACELALSRPR